jgi:hypothetical protein
MGGWADGRMGRRGTIRATSYGQIERHLDLNLRPLHGVNLVSVDRRAVAAQLSRIAVENGPVHALSPIKIQKNPVTAF